MENDSRRMIHPGKYLNKMLEQEGMTQKELSIRTGMTEKHISTIINGKKNISASFAKKLEYALPETMTYWMELQAKYDNEMLDYEEKHGIDKDELKIVSDLKSITEFLQKMKIIEMDLNEADLVLQLRKYMRVSSLKAIPEISYNAAYRAQVNNNVNVNPYILYAWKRICETYVSDINITNSLDVDKLKKKLSEIKELMFLDINEIEKRLTAILAECGIAFKIVPHFRGAPVQGFISKREDDKLMLCITLRQKRADKFWFTLFHEFGHIINGDSELRFVDFDSIKSEAEEQADLFAGNCLIDADDYRAFWNNDDFSLSAIKRFSSTQKVKPYIVIGRLQTEGELEWSDYSNEMVYYDWA
ncbi:MAG: HigA family addiction module antidote protein [Pseudobutyrivibrio sp.]|nr:HigA family addiction module antidote protein [Pseudobutyrivibrio sp.]